LRAARRLVRQAELPTHGIEDYFNSTFIVAESAGRIVGTVGVEVYGRYGLLRSLTVAPDWKGMGIGKSLTRDRLAWAKSRGMIALFLLTFEPSYFERFGFRPVRRDSVPPEIRRSPEYSTICPETATVMVLPIAYSDDELREGVRQTYAAIARQVEGDTEASCCRPSCCEPEENPITSNLYAAEELAEIPEKATVASLGCGNPTALAALEPGDVVLDLGSGGGIDVFLSARRVGPTGKAYGLDMTDEMLDIARQNQRKAGVTNAEFLKGTIEAIPLPDDSVDVIISNCVINLSTDKRQVLAEAFRVLKPGGRFAVSDIVARGALPESIRRDIAMWAGCLAGSIEESEYQRLLQEVGFGEIEIEPTRIYRDADIGVATAADAGDPGRKSGVGGMFMSAFIRAKKPL
jgi:N-acetylglutamate synthase-like GNAT family acetyltransferase/SAM-dependent methyltransferase